MCEYMCVYYFITETIVCMYVCFLVLSSHSNTHHHGHTLHDLLLLILPTSPPRCNALWGSAQVPCTLGAHSGVFKC